jgi:hypothetical protein
MCFLLVNKCYLQQKSLTCSIIKIKQCGGFPMQKIYIHIGNQFYDHKQLEATQEFELGLRDKPRHGMWASPFNIKGADTWEYFASANLNQNANRHVDVLNRRESQRFEVHLKEAGYSKDEFYQLPYPQRSEITKDYDYCAYAYTPDEMQKAIELDRQSQYQYGASERINSFAFTVDQDKILQVTTMFDIAPYIKAQPLGDSGLSYDVIDFDKIKGDGYSGVELCNACGLHYGVFSTWDVDSIVIWDPNCVHEIPKEIAYIARSIADAKDMFDAHDPMSDDVTLTRWLAEHIPLIDIAIENEIFTKQEIVQFIEHAIELDEQRRGLAEPVTEDLRQEEINIER